MYTSTYYMYVSAEYYPSPPQTVDAIFFRQVRRFAKLGSLNSQPSTKGKIVQFQIISNPLKDLVGLER